MGQTNHGKHLEAYPVSEDGASIDQDFNDTDGSVLFKSGPELLSIWHWFESENIESSCGSAIYGRSHGSVDVVTVPYPGQDYFSFRYRLTG